MATLGQNRTQTLSQLFANGHLLSDWGKGEPTPNEPGTGVGNTSGPFRYYALDLITKKIIDEVPFSSFEFYPVYNRAGGWSATINTYHPKASKDIFAKGRTAIVVVDRGEPRFAGMVWTTPEQPDGTLKVGGAEIWDYFAHRQIRTNLPPFVGQDQFQIVKALIGAAQAGYRESVGLNVRWSALSGVLRDRVYDQTERKAYASAVQELAELDQGFEFKVTPQWVNGEVSMFLDLANRLGRDTDHVWYLGKTVALTSDYDDDGSIRANLVDAIGTGAGSGKLISTRANPPVETLRLETTTSYSDVSNKQILDGHAAADLDRADQDQVSTKVRLLDLDQFGLGVWNLGDRIQLVRQVEPGGRVPYHVIDDQFRIQGYKASVDDKGKLAIEVDLVLGLNLGKPRPTARAASAAKSSDIDRRVTNLEKTR